jgi:hypothetical protein
MPSFPLQIRTSEDGAIYRLEEGDIIEWRQNGSSDLKRGRVTTLQSKGGRDQDRFKPIRIAPIGINSAVIQGRERWKRQIANRGTGKLSFKNPDAPTVKREAEEDWTR